MSRTITIRRRDQPVEERPLFTKPPVLTQRERDSLSNPEFSRLERQENLWCWNVEHPKDMQAMSKMQEAHRQEWIARKREPDSFGSVESHVKASDKRQEIADANERANVAAAAKAKRKAAGKAEAVICSYCEEPIEQKPGRGRRRLMHEECKEEKAELARIEREEREANG